MAFEETYEHFEAAEGSAPSVVLTCEHASQRLPEGWAWPEADHRLLDTHWAYDLGAADITRRLAAKMGVPATLSNFSRLLVDPNRALDSDTLFRPNAEGLPVELNQGIDDADRERRLVYYRGYHDRIDRMVEAHSSAAVIFAIHSFTPVYEGESRHFDLGVLFDRDEALGAALGEHLAHVCSVRLNEPYSGKLGLIYCADKHAQTHDRQAVEIEVRQDLAEDDAFVTKLVDAMSTFDWRRY